MSRVFMVVGWWLCAMLAACSDDDRASSEVVVYTSVDQVHAEPVFKAFERDTGVRVKALYDVEASKTTGLVARLLAEAQRPQADVFWNGEFVQTALLAERGVLAAYKPRASPTTRKQFGDGLWTTFGGRARVLLVNTSVLTREHWPASLLDFLDGRRSANSMAMAYPLFGTSATHAAALYMLWGGPRARAWFAAVNVRGVRIVDGNSVVRDLVARGEVAYGLTDTDDACNARRENRALQVLFPDQDVGGMGTLVVPNSVALIADGPNPETGKQLIDYLLSEPVIAALSRAGWFHVDGSRVTTPDCGLPASVKAMKVDLGRLAETMPVAMRELRETIVR